MADLANTGIETVYNAISPKMSAVETELRQKLGAIPDGGPMTMEQLLQVQMLMAKYTTTSAVFGSVIKELGDSLKSGAQKIG